MPITGISTRLATAATCSRAIARIAGPETPPVRPPSHGSPVSGSSAIPFSVFTSETASAPAPSAAAATAAGSRGVRRELHDQRLRRLRPHALDRQGGLGRVRAHDQAGLHVRAGHVQLQHRDLVALAHRGHEVSELLAREAHHRDHERHRQARQLGQVRGEEALQALVRQPDRVDHPGGGLPEPRRRVALARLEGDRLRDEGVEREPLEQGVAEGAPGGDGVEGAGAVEDRAARGGRRRARSLRPGRTARLQAVGVQHRAVHAEAQVAVGGGHDASEAGPEPARHPRLERELGGHVALGAERPHRLQHRGRPAGVDRRARVGVELGGEQLGHERLPADRAVVGGHTWLAAEQRRRLGVRRGAEAEQHAWSRRAPPGGTAAARHRCRRPRGSAGSRRAAA